MEVIERGGYASVRDFMKAFGVSRSTVYEWIEKGVLVRSDTGARYRLMDGVKVEKRLGIVWSEDKEESWT